MRLCGNPKFLFWSLHFGISSIPEGCRGGCLLLHAATLVWSSNGHLAPRRPHLSPLAKKGDKCSCFSRSLSARCRDSICPGRKTPKRQGQPNGLISHKCLTLRRYKKKKIKSNVLTAFFKGVNGKKPIILFPLPCPLCSFRFYSHYSNPTNLPSHQTHLHPQAAPPLGNSCSSFRPPVQVPPHRKPFLPPTQV